MYIDSENNAMVYEEDDMPPPMDIKTGYTQVINKDGRKEDVYITDIVYNDPTTGYAIPISFNQHGLWQYNYKSLPPAWFIQYASDEVFDRVEASVNAWAAKAKWKIFEEL